MNKQTIYHDACQSNHPIEAVFRRQMLDEKNVCCWKKNTITIVEYLLLSWEFSLECEKSDIWWAISCIIYLNVLKSLWYLHLQALLILKVSH